MGDSSSLMFPAFKVTQPSTLLPHPQAATGEEIGAEELGGADVHCGISGCTDHYAASEDEAMKTARSIVASLNRKRRSHPGRIDPGK